MRILLTAAVLVFAPMAAMACPAHEVTAQSCMQGYQWDAESGICVQSVTG